MVNACFQACSPLRRPQTARNLFKGPNPFCFRVEKWVKCLSAHARTSEALSTILCTCAGLTRSAGMTYPSRQEEGKLPKEPQKGSVLFLNLLKTAGGKEFWETSNPTSAKRMLSLSLSEKGKETSQPARREPSEESATGWKKTFPFAVGGKGCQCHTGKISWVNLLITPVASATPWGK